MLTLLEPEPYQPHSIHPNWGGSRCHRGPKIQFRHHLVPQRKLRSPKLKYEVLKISEVRGPFKRKVLMHYNYFGPWAQFGGGYGGRVPPLCQTGGHNMPCPPTFFLFRFCIWRRFKTKNVCHVLCEELIMLDGRPHIAKLILKESLVSVILLVYEF